MKWILMLMLFPALAFGSENCVTQYKGTCRAVCLNNEEAAEGAFIDCSDKEECCVSKTGTDSASEKKDSPGKEEDRK